jgi:alanyl-tRNA synthetase
VLGEHVQQRGSLVEPSRLRFDFSHLASLTDQEIYKIQEIVNSEIRHNHPVYDKQMSYKEAVASGAIALFDEKYGDVVRVLSVGLPPISTELCGGTHVSATGEIGLIEITTETSVGSGLRRVEAVTGRQAIVENQNRVNTLKALAGLLDTNPAGIMPKAQTLIKRAGELEKRIESLERDEALKAVPSLLNHTVDVSGVRLVASRVDPCRPETLRDIGDSLRDKLGSAVVVLGTVNDGKPFFVVTVSLDLTLKGYNAGNIIRHIAAITGGGGGGKPNYAQGGGKDISRLDEAIAAVPGLLQKK